MCLVGCCNHGLVKLMVTADAVVHGKIAGMIHPSSSACREAQPHQQQLKEAELLRRMDLEPM